MLTFKNFIKESRNSKVLTHLTHLEDRIFYGGVSGARECINFLRAVRDSLSGSADKRYNTTLKLDGAPSIVAGIDPSDGKFFVAKKGIFNKNPKLYKTVDDVKVDTSGDLQAKLIVALREFSKLGIKGIIQGDLMFTKSDVKRQVIDGKRYVIFQANTIVYAVPADSPDAHEITSAEIGVVWHTSYEGVSITNMQAKGAYDSSGLNKVPSVWSQDAILRNQAGSILMTAKETKEVTDDISKAGKLLQQISSTTLKEIENNMDLQIKIETFNNTKVRARTSIMDTKKHVDELIAWIKKKFDDEGLKRSSDRGKTAVKQRADELLKFFSDQNRANLVKAFDLYVLVSSIKEKLINKLESASKLKTFLRKKDGFEITGHEGYVVIDKTNDGMVKFVKRMEFSYANFSPDIIKAFDLENR